MCPSITCLFFSKKTLQLSKDMICRVCGRDGCTPLTDEVDGHNIMSAMRSITNITVSCVHLLWLS